MFFCFLNTTFLFTSYEISKILVEMFVCVLIEIWYKIINYYVMLGEFQTRLKIKQANVQMDTIRAIFSTEDELV